MRRLFRFIAALLAAAMLLAGMPALASEAADLLFVNGFIYTVDGQETIAEALAVQDGKIVFVGSGAEAAAYQGEGTEVVDLQGQMMLPGLIDSHLHSVMPSFFDFSLLGLTTLEDVLAAIAAYVAKHPEKEIFNGFGYLTSIFEGKEVEKGPRKERLDAIVSDRPLAILSFDGHTMWTNSKFLQVHGITAETESPRGGILEKDDETGEPWGTLKDSAIALGGDDVYDEETLKAELPKFVNILNSFGYTSIMTLPAFGTMPVPFDAYAALEDAGGLTIKVHGATSIMDFRYEEDLRRMVDTAEKYNTDMIKMRTAKFFMDGVLDVRTAFLLEPYNDVDSLGMAGWDLDTLREVYTRVNDLGFQIHAHAIGDAAIRLSLDAMEYAKEHAAPGDYRNVITHLQLVAASDIPRLGALGVVAVAQPYWHYRQPEYWDVVEYAAVGERAEREYPMKAFLDTGAMIASSSDYPVTPIPNAFEAIEIGVIRNMPASAAELAEYGLEAITDIDDPRYLNQPGERLTVQEMIRSFTLNGAYLTHSDEETGSLEVGKAADLIVINQNLLEINPLDISMTEVLQTYVNGVLVYNAVEE